MPDKVEVAVYHLFVARVVLKDVVNSGRKIIQGHLIDAEGPVPEVRVRRGKGGPCKLRGGGRRRASSTSCPSLGPYLGSMSVYFKWPLENVLPRVFIIQTS